MGLDVEAEALRASVRGRLFGDVALPKVGRYALQRRVGRGGMGVVYAALDPELGRTVALKVLRPQGPGVPDDAREARLVREARTLARLSHPNVVSVYAVERIDGVVCIAMEFVRGQTLQGWLDAQPRSTADIVGVFIEAARGLAAAHREGVVHRDFKPPNVMVGAAEGRARRGRVRVLDFGLARADEQPDDTTHEVFGSGSGSATQTQTGTVMGTRGYMAPELREGPATPASDQFSFFLSLYDALAGPRDLTAKRRVLRMDGLPRRLRRVVRRGLAKEPADRFADMDAVVDALEATQRSRWPWVAAAGAVGAASLAGILLRPGIEDPCAAFDRRIDAAWGEGRRDEVQVALSSAPAFAQSAWDVAQPRVELAVEAAVDAGRDACTAGWSEGRMVDPDAAQRLACLQTQLLELDAALRRFTDAPAGPGQLDLASFDPVSACTQSEPANDAETLAVQEAVARARGLLRVGAYAQAHTLMEETVRAAQPLRSAAVRADALLVAAGAARSAGDFSTAQTRAQAALSEATAARVDRIEARAWILLVDLQLAAFGRQAEAERMLVPAKAAVARVDDPRLRADLTAVEAMLADHTARPDAAIALYESALEAYPDAPATALRRASLLQRLARAMRRAGQAPQSRPVSEEALRLTKTVLGPRHPEVGQRLIGVGTAANHASDAEAAWAAFDEAVGIFDESVGPDHPSRAAALHDRGTAAASLDRMEEAEIDLTEAARIDRVTLGEDNPGRTQSLYSLALVLHSLGRVERATAVMQEALDVQERAWGVHHPDLAYVVGGLAEFAVARGDLDAALAGFRRARALLTPALGEQHPRLVYPLIGEARVARAQEDAAAAVSLLEAARRITAAGASEPMIAAQVAFELARALEATAAQPERITALDAEAKAACAGAKGQVKTCTEILAYEPA
ncbi:MAG: serine/threonine-protein kinase [Myxococcota bacterium]